MKKIKYISIGLIVLSFSACKKEEIEEPNENNSKTGTAMI